MKTMFRGGYIYSPVPEATAMLIDGDTVAWVGDDVAAQVYLDDDTSVVELEGAFVAPPFIDAFSNGEPAPGCGYVLPAKPTGFAAVGGPIYWSEEPHEAAIYNVTATHQSGEEPVSIVLDPGLSKTAKELANGGVPFCFGSWGKYTSPWEWIALAAGTKEEPGLSERGAFLAATRGAVRAFGNVDWPTDGILGQGTKADFAIWSASEIDVRSADPRIAAWSTDPRSGVPGLPAVGPDLPDPELKALYLAGNEQAEPVVIETKPGETPWSEH